MSSRNPCFCGVCMACIETIRWAKVLRDRVVSLGGCRCGRFECDCAEWDRIYREKFEDPDYYRSAIPRMTSPLD